MGARSVDALVTAYVDWMRERDGVADPSTVRRALRHRADHLDGRLTHWTTGDLAETLQELIVWPSDVDGIVSGARSLVEYLAASRQLDRGSDPLPLLLEALDEIEEAVAFEPDSDGTNLQWDLGGRLSLPEDFAAAPVRLAPSDELAAAAREAPAITRLAGLVDWVGKGRRLDEDGQLTRAHVRELAGILGIDAAEPCDNADLDSSVERAAVELVREWAELADLGRTRGDRLVGTRSGRRVDADPLGSWKAVFESRLELGVVDLDGNGPPWGQTVDGAMADLVVLAHLRGEPMPVQELVEGLWDEEDELRDDAPGGSDASEGLHQAMAEDVWRVVEALADLGTITIEDGSCSITPLGAWAAVELMRDDGYDAPVVGELAHSDAATVLDACGEMDVEDAAAELTSWLEARDTDEAVRQLADAARAGAVADRRAMLFYALGQLADDAAGAVRTLQDDAVLRPYATAWLVERGFEDQHALGPDDVPAIMADQLAVALAVGGADALVELLDGLGPPAEQMQVLAAIGRVDTPAVDDVLEAVGSHHGVTAVARAARKTAFTRRSAGRS